MLHETPATTAGFQKVTTTVSRLHRDQKNYYQSVKAEADIMSLATPGSRIRWQSASSAQPPLVVSGYHSSPRGHPRNSISTIGPF